MEIIKRKRQPILTDWLTGFQRKCIMVMNYKSTEKASLSSRTGWQTFQQDMKSNYMKNNNTTTKSQPILADGLAK